MASKVFHVPLAVVLDLDLPDLGYPEVPDLWEQLHGNLSRGVLRCLGRHQGRCTADCPEWMYVREHPVTGTRFAAHLNPGESAWAPESDEHKALKERIARTATEAGFVASVEDRAAHGRRRTDVLVHGNDILLGCEPQLSPISVSTVRRRSTIAERDGITPLWATTSLTANVIDQAPWARIDRKTHLEYRERSQQLPVRGGVRALTSVRCTPTTVCNDQKLGQPCTGWNHHWEARQLRSFDDLIVRAAAADLRAVKQHISRGRAYYFWATSADLAQVEQPDDSGITITLGPVVTRRETDPAPAHRRRAGPDTDECTYGQDTFSTWSTTPIERSPATIPAQRIALPDTLPRVVLDWRAPQHVLTSRQPCRICQKPSFVADGQGRPCHKVCAEEELRRQQPL